MRPSDEELAPYFEFVRANVLEYTRGKLQLGLRQSRNLRFTWFMLRHGLSLPTVAAAAGQLLSERFGRTRWRRATMINRPQFDVFRHHYRTVRPTFSTYFVNSSAATVVFAAALSQQPSLPYESVGGKILHKPHGFESLLRNPTGHERALRRTQPHGGLRGLP